MAAALSFIEAVLEWKDVDGGSTDSDKRQKAKKNSKKTELCRGRTDTCAAADDAGRPAEGAEAAPEE
eukprot:1348946-Rhodomonas_salina.2